MAELTVEARGYLASLETLQLGGKRATQRDALVARAKAPGPIDSGVFIAAAQLLGAKYDRNETAVHNAQFARLGSVDGYVVRSIRETDFPREVEPTVAALDGAMADSGLRYTGIIEPLENFLVG